MKRTSFGNDTSDGRRYKFVVGLETVDGGI